METSKKDHLSVSTMIEEQKQHSTTSFLESLMPKLLMMCALVSILTTAGIVYTLVKEAVTFFSRIPFIDFITGTKWYPLFDANPNYGVLPLIAGTLQITVIAMIVAIPIGLMTAMYLSEYASDRMRRIIKPILEILAGIPTIVYGFFALTFVTPLLKHVIDVGVFNALSAGIVVGIMIIPMIASLSEDAMNAVPNEIRQGAFALGSTRFEVAVKVVLPAAFSGIVSSIVLGISRAIGETMIVTVAAGNSPKFTADPTQSIQTMTAFIVQVTHGDASFGSTAYYSMYAVGITLFVLTLLMNLLANAISRRFREDY